MAGQEREPVLRGPDRGCDEHGGPWVLPLSAGFRAVFGVCIWGLGESLILMYHNGLCNICTWIRSRGVIRLLGLGPSGPKTDTCSKAANGDISKQQFGRAHFKN